MSDVIPKSEEELSLAFSIFEESNPLSLINLVDSEKWKETLFRMQSECPKMFFAEEKDIESKAQPSPLVYRLRLAFWDEYERALSVRKKMRLNSVISHHCDKKHFYENILTNNMWMLFIITPPRKYELSMRHILEKSTQRLQRIMDIDPIDEDGRVDLKLAHLQYKIHAWVDNRVRGSVAQKLQIQSHIVSQQVPPEEQYYEKLSVRELEKLASTHRRELREPAVIEAELEKAE